MGGVLSLAFAGSAFGASFNVNSLGDGHDASGADLVCDTDTGTGGDQCTLRAAIEQANANGGAVNDTIGFASAISTTGNAGCATTDPTPCTITVVINNDSANNLPAITTPVDIDGCSSNPSATSPCVGVRADTLNGSLSAFNVNLGSAGTGDSFSASVRGIAFTNLNTGVRYSDFGHGDTTMSIENNRFGLKLDGVSESVGFGVSVVGANADVGGPDAGDRNVFANSTGVGLQIASGDDGTVQGNYFGVKADGTTSAPNNENVEVVHNTTATGGAPDDTLIGGTVTGPAATTPACDGVCNVFANATSASINDGNGIDVFGEVAFSESPPGPTTIAGNFIGLAADGATTAYNQRAAINVRNTAALTVGGPAAGDRNFITDEGSGVSAMAQGAAGLEVRNNFFGLDSTGASNTWGPTAAIAVGVVSVAADPAVISGNRFSVPRTSNGQALLADGDNTTISGNVVGVAATGANLTGGGTAMRILDGSGLTITQNTIGNARIAMSLEGISNSEISGNALGTNSAGTSSHSLEHAGIAISSSISDTSVGNVIGGDTLAEENLISNVTTGPAIYILDDSSEDNEIQRNRGSNNGTLLESPFIDLGGDGPGNSTGVNGGVQSPTITLATGDLARGTSAPGATVRVFSKATSSIGEVEAFAGEAEADLTGQWEVIYSSPMPDGKLVSATQTLAADTSELSPPVATDAAGPDTQIDSGPSGPTQDATPTFTFSAPGESSPSFECRIDAQPFSACSGPGAQHTPPTALADGAHTFEVQATDEADNTDPNPASRSFTVDTAAPQTTITGGPKKRSRLKRGKRRKRVTFTFASSEPGEGGFQCQMDNRAFVLCNGGSFTTKVRRGRHTFRVRAFDDAGNPDPSLATRSFRIRRARRR